MAKKKSAVVKIEELNPELPSAVISDIHGNASALDTVFKDIETFGIKTVICLGDTVGYGPDSLECVRRVMESCLISVLGNHEAMLLHASTKMLEKAPTQISQPLLAARKELVAESIEWIGSQPLVAIAGTIGFSHSSRYEPMHFHYVHNQTDAALHFIHSTEDVTFFGHTHRHAIWQEREVTLEDPVPYEESDCGIHLKPGKRHAINVGSVGLPREEDPRPCYAIYNPGTRVVLFRRI